MNRSNVLGRSSLGGKQAGTRPVWQAVLPGTRPVWQAVLPGTVQLGAVFTSSTGVVSEQKKIEQESSDLRTRTTEELPWTS